MYIVYACALILVMFSFNIYAIFVCRNANVVNMGMRTVYCICMCDDI